MKTMKVLKDLDGLESLRAKSQGMSSRVDQGLELLDVLIKKMDAFLFFRTHAHIELYPYRAKGRVWSIERGWTKDELRAALGRGVEKNAGNVSHWVYVHGADIVNFMFIDGLLCRIVES